MIDGLKPTRQISSVSDTHEYENISFFNTFEYSLL